MWHALWKKKIREEEECMKFHMLMTSFSLLCVAKLINPRACWPLNYWGHKVTCGHFSPINVSLNESVVTSIGVLRRSPVILSGHLGQHFNRNIIVIHNLYKDFKWGFIQGQPPQTVILNFARISIKNIPKNFILWIYSIGTAWSISWLQW